MLKFRPICRRRTIGTYGSYQEDPPGGDRQGDLPDMRRCGTGHRQRPGSTVRLHQRLDLLLPVPDLPADRQQGSDRHHRGVATKAGSRVVAWSLPAELSEPKIGPPICHDDLLEFHLALERDAWEQELAALGDR